MQEVVPERATNGKERVGERGSGIEMGVRNQRLQRWRPNNNWGEWLAGFLTSRRNLR